jgi:hypothetical protein
LLEKILKSLKSRGKVRGNFVPLLNHVVSMFEQEMKQLKEKPQLLPYAKMGLNMRLWKTKYEELAKKSGQRDTKGWHTLDYKYFDSERSNQWDGLPIHYMGTAKAQGGDPPAYMEIIRSPTFRLNPTFDQI